MLIASLSVDFFCGTPLFSFFKLAILITIFFVLPLIEELNLSFFILLNCYLVNPDFFPIINQI